MNDENYTKCHNRLRELCEIFGTNINSGSISGYSKSLAFTNEQISISVVISSCSFSDMTLCTGTYPNTLRLGLYSEMDHIAVDVNGKVSAMSFCDIDKDYLFNLSVQCAITVDLDILKKLKNYVAEHDDFVYVVKY